MQKKKKELLWVFQIINLLKIFKLDKNKNQGKIIPLSL